MTASMAVRLEYAWKAQSEPGTAEHAAAVLARETLDELNSVSGRSRDRWMDKAPRSVNTIATYLRNSKYDAVSFESTGGDLVAAADIDTSLGKRAAGPTALRGYIVIPVRDDVERVIGDLCELAGILSAGAGFVAVEPSFGQAHRIAVGASKPKAREALSELRQLGRRGRDWKSELLASKVATIEWGTFLGAGHLAQIDLDEVRRSKAFDRVVSVSPSLAFLQVTANPLDDLSGELEKRLPRAREVLQPLLMDLSDVNLD